MSKQTEKSNIIPFNKAGTQEMLDTKQNRGCTLMDQLLLHTITLEEAYCIAKNYLASVKEPVEAESETELMGYFRALSFIEEVLAEKYMKAAGYERIEENGVEIWKKS